LGRREEKQVEGRESRKVIWNYGHPCKNGKRWKGARLGQGAIRGKYDDWGGGGERH